MTRPSTVSDLRRVLDHLPDDARLYVYVRGSTARVHAEWSDKDQHLQNPVILLATYELSGASGAEVVDP